MNPKILVPLLLSLLIFLPRLVHGAEFSVADKQSLTAAVESFNKGLIDAARRAFEEPTAAELSYGHSREKEQDRAIALADVLTLTMHRPSMRTSGQVMSLVDATASMRHLSAGNLVEDDKSSELQVGNPQISQ